MLKLIFTGYIGADCRVKNVNDQVAITFSVGVTKQYKNRQGVQVSNTTWVGCTIWRKPDNVGRITEYLKAGKQVLVEGEPSARGWISNADNLAKSALDCRVEKIELLGKADALPAAEQQAPATTEQISETAPAPLVGNQDNDDLPF